MKHLVLLLSALALLLGAAAFLVFADVESESPAGDQAPALELGFQVDDREGEPLRFDPGLGPADETLPGDSPVGIARSLIPTEEGEPLAAHEALVIQVWDGAEGVAAPRARVFVLDEVEGRRGRGRDGVEELHWSELPELHGRPHQADGRGRLVLPPVESFTLVSAHLPGKFGFARIRREHREVESITLVPDETILVRVTDPMERAVPDATVALLQDVPRRPRPEPRQELDRIDRRIRDAQRWAREDPDRGARAISWIKQLHDRRERMEEEARRDRRRSSRNRGGPRTEGPSEPEVRRDARARRRTDAEGMATFRHFQLFRQRAEEWWPAENVDRFACALEMPLQQSVEVEFAGVVAGERELALSAPGTGRLIVRTVDLDGRPFRHPVHVNLRVRGTKDAPRLETRQRKRENEERIEFAHVALGSVFEAECRLDDNDFRWEVASIAGPAEPGQTVVRVLVVAPDAGMLRGRVLGADGEPLVAVRPTFLINSEVGRLEGEDVTLDEEGRFHLPFKVDERHRGPFRLTVRLAAETSMAGTERAFDELPTQRVTDLGDLRLEDLACIAHGSVLDDRGQPVRGASVQLQVERPTSAEDPTPRFVDEAFHRTRTDEEGRYELLGDVEPGRFRLRVQARDHEPFDSEDLRLGERLDVRLARIARLLGTVRTPEWLEDDEMFVRLAPSFGPGETREEKLLDLLGNGTKSFLWERVKPGIYAVEFHVRQFPDPLLRLDGIQVSPGLQEVHPLLKDVELRGLLHRFVIRAMDGSGRFLEPDRPLLAKVARPDGSTGFVGFPWRDARVEVVSAEPTLEVLPMAMGYRAAATVLGPGENTLVFRELPAVEIAVPGLRAQLGETPVRIGMVPLDTSSLPRELVSWDERSQRTSRWYRWSQAALADLGQDERARVRVMLDGKYRVMAHLGGRGRGRRPTQVWLANVDVVLVPGGAPPVFSLTFDPSAVQKGLAELAQIEAARAERERQRPQQQRGR